MNTGIFETEHFEGAYPLIKLFDNGENRVTIFTNTACYRQFRYLLDERIKEYNWVIKEENESKYRFMWRTYQEVRKNRIELLYLNTINDNFIFYALMIALLRRVRIILTLHDINTFFRHKFKFSLRRWIRITGKIALISLIKEFNVVSLTMVDYLKHKLPHHKKVHCLPGAVYEDRRPLIQPAVHDRINIVVPGTIDNRRRDYNQVFELLNLAAAEELKISVVLLGGPYEDYGYDVIERCKTYAKTKNNLVFYHEKVVDQPEFDRQLDQADFIFIPSVVYTVISDDIAETYGESKSSGNVFDIIKHAKPFIAPWQLQLDPYLESSCIRYRSVEEIVKALAAIHSNEAYHAELSQLAYEASLNYTVKAVRKRNPDLFFHPLSSSPDS